MNCAFHCCSSKRPEKRCQRQNPQWDLWHVARLGGWARGWSVCVGVPQSAMTASHSLSRKLTFYCCLHVAARAHIKPHKKVVNSIVIRLTKHRKWAERAGWLCLGILHPLLFPSGCYPSLTATAARPQKVFGVENKTFSLLLLYLYFFSSFIFCAFAHIFCFIVPNVSLFLSPFFCTA